MDLHERDDELEWTLLARYLAGECSAAERAVVDAWAASTPERAAELRGLARWWSAAADVPSAGRVDAMWGALSARMHGERAVGPVRTPTATPVFSLGSRRPAASPGRAWRRAAGAIAASLLVTAGGTFAWRSHVAQPAAVPAPVAMREFATGRGQRATIHLVDGTRVELGFGSRLRVRPFESGRREIYLEGEAVFDVVHDARRPFLVHAANATTEDLGTVFAVRAYAGAPAVRVVVLSGRVALRPRGATAAADQVTGGTALGRGQLGVLDSSGRVEVTSDVDTAAYLGWLADRAVFHNATLAEVAAELGRRFDVDVQIPDSAVARRRVTVDMPARSLVDVLDAATVPLGLRHHRAGRTIVVER